MFIDFLGLTSSAALRRTHNWWCYYYTYLEGVFAQHKGVAAQEKGVTACGAGFISGLDGGCFEASPLLLLCVTHGLGVGEEVLALLVEVVADGLDLKKEEKRTGGRVMVREGRC